MLPLVMTVAAVAVLLVFLLKFVLGKSPGPNPFDRDHRRPAGPHVADTRARDSVLKQGLTAAKLQESGPFDVVVIGSGIGGLATAALLSRAGKKVLVLEQHDQAGGCCHTFYEKGYEFDTGIHYIGEMRHNTLMRFLLQQLTAGQLQWTEMDPAFDIVMLGDPESPEGTERIPIVSGRQEFTENLVKYFPGERQAIEKYVSLVADHRRSIPGGITAKVLPPLAGRLLKLFGLVDSFTPYFKLSTKTLGEVLDGLTTNDKLKAVLAYCYGDYGSPPKMASFGMHATLVTHYQYGVAYPQGGPSEIPFHIIPEIEKNGGRVFVRAKVSEILVSPSGAVSGVRVLKGASGNSALDIPCTTVVSTAGVFNTFESLLPEQVRSQHPDIDRLLSRVQHSFSCFSVFIGLTKSSAELQLPAASYWNLDSVNLDKDFQDYIDLDVVEASTAKPPLLFVSFPSAKDSTWDERFPGKSNALVIALARYEWFSQWEDERIMKRSKEYNELKQAFQDTIVKRVCALLPQIEDAIDFVDTGTPVTNKFYLNSPEGEIYSADHNVARFEFDTFSQLRPQTCVPGLYLSGQDILTCGFGAAMFAGLLTAGAILNRNLMADMMKLRSKAPVVQSCFPKSRAPLTATVVENTNANDIANGSVPVAMPVDKKND